MVSEISKASESLFLSRTSEGMVEELEKRGEICEQIEAVEKLVSFYFERVKEGCWLTEDLQNLILDRLKKCYELAQRSKDFHTPQKDSLFAEEQPDLSSLHQKLGAKRSAEPLTCTSFHLEKRQRM
jgi:hypothetical protein